MDQLTQAQVDDYRRLKGLEAVMVGNPEVERDFNKLLRKADPRARIPKLELEEQIAAGVSERTKDLEAQLKEVTKRQLEREADEINTKQKARLRRAPFNLTDEEIEECIKMVNEKYKEGEVLSLETAARAYLSSRPTFGSSPVKTPFSTRFQRPKNDFRKELRNPKSRLFSDTRNYVNEEFDKAWDEGIEIINQGQ
jgi:hypothetical protein